MKSVWCLWCVWRGFLFSEDGQPCIIDYKTLLQCYFIFPAQLTVNRGFTFFQVEFVLMCATVCVMLFSPHSPTSLPPLSPPFPIAPSGRLNGRYAETIPLSPHPTTCSTLTEKCTRQKTKVGRDNPMWNNGRVKYNLMVIAATLSHITAFIWLHFELRGAAVIKTHSCILRHFGYICIS